MRIIKNILPIFLFSGVRNLNGFRNSNTVGFFNLIPKTDSTIHRFKITTTLYASSNKKSLKTRSISPYYSPKTENQKLYVDYLSNPSVSIVLAYGSAGTGKTLFACSQAVNELQSGRIQKIVITRPVVSVEKEEIGFLPGNLIHKMDPWTRPLFDIMLEYYSQKDIDSMLHSGVLEISPLAYMRGRTFKRAFIIADEMQNSSPNQMLMLTTRIGTDSKMVITGDLKQSDRGKDNGLQFFIHKLKTAKESIPEIKTVEMVNSDIQRSVIVSKILDLFSESGSDSDSISNSTVSGNQNKNVTVSGDIRKEEGCCSTKDCDIDINRDAALLPTKYISLKQKFIWDPTSI